MSDARATFSQTADQIHWEPAPPPSKERYHIPIARPNPKNGFQVRAIILSPKVHGTKTHYAGRTRICTESTGQCEFCDQGQKQRWIGYLAAWDTSLRSKCLLELTEGPMPTIARYLCEHPDLRGAILCIEKPTRRANGRNEITSIEKWKSSELEKLPDEFDVRAQLHRIWQIKTPEEAHGLPAEFEVDKVYEASAQTKKALAKNRIDKALQAAQRLAPKVNGNSPATK